MSYTTPPSLNPSLKQEIDSMVSVFAANSTAIAEKLLYNGLQASGVTPKISLPPLIQMINNLIVPVIHHWEGGWADHPKDSGGCTMRGIILKTFKIGFNTIFINTGIPQAKTAAEQWNKKYPNWRDNDEIGKQLLYLVGSNTRVASLFVCWFLSSKDNRYPIAVMTEDPYLGYLFASSCWAVGAGCYLKGYTDLNGMLEKFGWNGVTSSWATTILGLGDKTAEAATQTLLYRYNHYMRISRPGTDNEVFRKGWLNRLLNDNKSDLMMLVIINEKFNLNANGEYKLSQAELNHLKRKAECYKKLSIEIPG